MKNLPPYIYLFCLQRLIRHHCKLELYELICTVFVLLMEEVFKGKSLTVQTNVAFKAL